MIIRTTGVLIENQKILLLQQATDEQRTWSLPGGKLEEGETLEESIIREMKEETGLDVVVEKLLYICDYIRKNKHVVHITFNVHRAGGILGVIDNNHDTRKIHTVDMIPIKDLHTYGFDDQFITLLNNNFQNAGAYMGDKKNIGL